MKRHALLAAASLAVAAPAAAQQPREAGRLDSIVVTATRLPLPRASVASAVTVVSGEELREKGVTSLLEALRGIPGAGLVQGGTFGAPASLFVRGGESDYVKVLVDGVPVNEPGGAFDFAHLAAENVERIEVVRGPTSVLYGSDAVAGVVQVFTREGRGAARWLLGGDAGTYGTTRLRAEVWGGGDRAGFGAAASRLASDGTYGFNSGYRRTEASLLARGRVGVRTDGRLTVRVNDHRTQFPTDGAGRAVDRNQFTTGRGATVGLDGGYLVSPRLEVRALLASHSGDAGYDDRADGPADTAGFFAYRSVGHTLRRSADLRAVVRLGPDATLTLGGALERQRLRSRDSSDSQWGASRDSLLASRRNGAAYAQLVADAGGRLALHLGARLDRNQRFGSFGAYRAGLSWRLGPLSRLRAAAGNALKEPTFFEQFASGWVVGNPDLRPERSRSWELGADVQAGRHGPSLSATVFRQRFADLIQYDPAPAGGGVPTYVNVAAARASGLEAEATWALARHLTARVHYTYLRTAVTDAGKDQSGSLAEGRRLLRRPAHAFGASVTFAEGGRSVWVSAGTVGARDDLDYGSESAVARVRLPAYTRVDAAATVPVLGRAGSALLAAAVRVENLLGTRYEEVRGFPARRRTIAVGLRAEGGLR